MKFDKGMDLYDINDLDLDVDDGDIFIEEYCVMMDMEFSFGELGYLLRKFDLKFNIIVDEFWVEVLFKELGEDIMEDDEELVVDNDDEVDLLLDLISCGNVFDLDEEFICK